MNEKGGGRVLDELTMRWLIGGGLIAAMLAGLVVALRWRLGAAHGAIYPPPRRYPLAPWSGLGVALALLLNYAIPGFAVLIATGVGYLPAIEPGKQFEGSVLYRLLLVRGLSYPVMGIAVLGLFWFGSRTRPKLLGLRTWRWQANLYIGYSCYAIVTPLVLGLNYLARWLNKTVGVEMQPHPFQRLVEDDPRPSTWLLVALQAVVFAPILEELLFRGIMLPWLARRWWGGWAAMAGAIAIGLVMFDQERGPLAFALVVSLIGIALTFPHAGEQWMRRAIIGTGLLFAMFHVHVWPTPIPLLVLGLALGWAAHRTRGLTAPIVLHALFNATSTLIMLAGIPPAKPKPTPAPEPPALTRTAARSLPPIPAPSASALP